MRITIAFFVALLLIGANAAQGQAIAILSPTQENYTAAIGLQPSSAVPRLRSRPQPAAFDLKGNALLTTTRAPLRDLEVARIQECKASPRGIALGATLGFLAGTAIGVVYGAAGHPGLPHIGADVPSELEYTPLFAVVGAVVGGIVGGRPHRECPTAEQALRRFEAAHDFSIQPDRADLSGF